MNSPLFDSKSRKWQIREFLTFPYFTRSLGEKFKILCFFYQKLVEIRPKLSRIGNLVLLGHFYGQ